jgi:hypothetical protein
MLQHNTVYIPERRLEASEAALAEELNNPGWRTMAEGVFGYSMPDNPDEKLAVMEGMVAGFDSRNGGSRDNAQPNLTLRTMIRSSEERQEAFELASTQLGQRGTVTPDFTPYTAVVPGAKVEATAARLLRAQNLGAKSLVLVGIRRALYDDELVSMGKLFPGLDYEKYGKTESGAMRAMVDHFYPEAAHQPYEIMDKSAETDARGNRGGKVSLFSDNNTPIYWVEAPVNLGLPVLGDDNYDKRRLDSASTAETYQFVGEEFGYNLGETIGIATNDVYRFMGADAKHIFESIHGIAKTALATFTPEDAAKLLNGHLQERGNEHRIEPKQRTEDTYAQEIRSLQRSLKRWYQNIQRSRENQA